MRPFSLLPFIVVPLFVGCAASEQEEIDDAEGAIGAESTPPTRETAFASGGVDLTTYTAAGSSEWTAFETFYRARHTHPKEKDNFDLLAERTKQKVAANQQAKLSSFIALKGYTSQTFWFFDTKPETEQDYKLINSALRNVARDPSAVAKQDLAKVEGYIKSAASAVNTMPAVPGTVHRRVFRSKCDAKCLADWLAPYEAGKFVREPSFVSTSEKEQATCFFRGQAHFIYESKGKAHSVKSLSEFPNEEEAIFAPGTVFQVTSIEPGKPIVCNRNDGWDASMHDPSAVEPTAETVIRLTAVE
jgi:hypothetical protein